MLVKGRFGVESRHGFGTVFFWIAFRLLPSPSIVSGIFVYIRYHLFANSRAFQLGSHFVSFPWRFPQVVVIILMGALASPNTLPICPTVLSSVTDFPSKWASGESWLDQPIWNFFVLFYSHFFRSVFLYSAFIDGKKKKKSPLFFPRSYFDQPWPVGVRCRTKGPKPNQPPSKKKNGWLDVGCDYVLTLHIKTEAGYFFLDHLHTHKLISAARDDSIIGA